MKIGVGLNRQSLLGYPSVYEQTGIKISHIQIRELPADITDIKGELKRDINTLHAANSKLEFSFHSGLNMNLAEQTKRVKRVWLELAKELIQFSRDVKANFVLFHCGWGKDLNGEVEREQLLTDLIPTIQELLDFAKERQIEIHLENLYALPPNVDFCYLGDTLSDFRYLFSQLQDPVLKFCYDYGHGNMDQEGIALLRNFTKRLGSIHAHDNDKLIDSHCPIGGCKNGTIDWENELRFLKAINFAGPLILEQSVMDQLKSLEYLKASGKLWRSVASP